jgi:hypothetical protein
VGNDRKISDVVHACCDVLQVSLTRAQNGKAVSAKAQIAKRCEGAKRRAEAKKKARRTIDAPSNKTIGNCLLGFHCSQKSRAANRAIARFLVVAGCQQDKSSTSYPQSLVDVLGIVLGARIRCRIGQKTSAEGHDCSG